MGKQFLQGGLTYVGIAVAAVSFLLDFFGLVDPICAAVQVVPCDAGVAAGVLVGLGVAVYGRFRRESRPDEAPPAE